MPIPTHTTICSETLLSGPWACLQHTASGLLSATSLSISRSDNPTCTCPSKTPMIAATAPAFLTACTICLVMHNLCKSRHTRPCRGLVSIPQKTIMLAPPAEGVCKRELFFYKVHIRPWPIAYSQDMANSTQMRQIRHQPQAVGSGFRS